VLLIIDCLQKKPPAYWSALPQCKTQGSNRFLDAIRSVSARPITPYRLIRVTVIVLMRSDFVIKFHADRLALFVIDRL
jgi:hypothetical protein